MITFMVILVSDAVIRDPFSLGGLTYATRGYNRSRYGPQILRGCNSHPMLGALDKIPSGGWAGMSLVSRPPLEDYRFLVA